MPTLVWTLLFLPIDWLRLGSCCPVTKLCLTVCDPMDCSMPGSPSTTVFWSLLKFMPTELVVLSNDHILCRPLLLLSSVFPHIRVLSCESALGVRWPKYWTFSISPSKEYSVMTSFRIDWFDLLTVWSSLKRRPNLDEGSYWILWLRFFMFSLHKHLRASVPAR